jgi:hypothetical protein
VEDGAVLCGGDAGGFVERREVDVVGAAIGVAQLAARERERGTHLDHREDAALLGGTPSTGASASDRVRPRFVAEKCHPYGPAKSISLRAARADLRRSRASSSMSSQPASVIGACSRSRWLMRRLPAGCRCRATCCRASGRRARRHPRLPPPRLLPVLDDVPLLEQDPLRDLAPERRAPQQELEVHGEVLELLALSSEGFRGASSI